MNGKKAKQSRALQRKTNAMLAKAEALITEQKRVDVGEIIASYNVEVFKQSFFKRLSHCWRIMNCGQSIFNPRTTYYWVILAGALGGFAFHMVVTYVI